MFMQQAFGGSAEVLSTSLVSPGLQEGRAVLGPRNPVQVEFTLEDLLDAGFDADEIPAALMAAPMTRAQLEAWCEVLAVDAALAAEKM